MDVAHHIGPRPGGTARVVIGEGGNPAQNGDTSGKLASISLLTNVRTGSEKLTGYPSIYGLLQIGLIVSKMEVESERLTSAPDSGGSRLPFNPNFETIQPLAA